MYYYVERTPEKIRQMTLDDLLFSDAAPQHLVLNADKTSTTTRASDYIQPIETEKVESYIRYMERYLDSVSGLREVEREKLYREFYIPKKSGSLRRIDAPDDNLKTALSELSRILTDTFGMMYHTTAFAYIKSRSTLDAVKKHQENESRWFAKFDLHDFFGSTTLPFVMNMLSQIKPTAQICHHGRGREVLEQAIELGFLKGGLPQGTPLSPTLTNIMMIPIDYTISKKLRELGGNYVITRYADDFIVSSKYKFDYKTVERIIVDTLSEFGAPFQLNTKKTRFGSSAGSNWNLGIMCTSATKDGKMALTVGNKNIRRFEAMISSYIMDKKNGRQWELHDVQVMEGLRSYYRSIEADVIDRIIAHINGKFGSDVVGMIKADLR